MPLPPKKRVVGRVVVTRLCGCQQEYEHLANDRFGDQKLEKFKKSRCPACAAKFVEEQQRLNLPKAEAFRRLPQGTEVNMVFGADGQWAATLKAEDRSVQGKGVTPEAALLAVARLWAAAL